MADFNEVAKQKQQDETPRPIYVFQRDAKPYLAPDGSRCTISVIGSEADSYRTNREKLQREAAESDVDSVESSANARIGSAAFACKEWNGWGPSMDAQPPCTAENLKVLLSVEHILVQVEAGIGRRSIFFADGSVA